MNAEGNPLCREVPQFRKKLIVKVGKLRYVDRPVFDDERAAAVAWSVGGYELEKKVKLEWKEKARDKDRQGLQDFRDWRAELRKKKEEEMAAELVRGGPSEENLKKREAQEAATKEREEEARDEAAKEKALYSNENAALAAGAAFWNTEEIKDNFGNVIKAAPKPLPEPVRNTGEGVEILGREEEEEAEEEKSVPDIYSFQGQAPGAKKIEAKAAAEEVEVEEEEEEDSSEDGTTKSDDEGSLGGGGVESDDERQMRVDESLQIYRAQQEVRKKGPAANLNANNANSSKATSSDSSSPPLQGGDNGNASAAALEGILSTERNFSDLLNNAKEAAEREVVKIDNPSANGFYWTEAMDFSLSKSVHSCVYDFAAVSAALQSSLSLTELAGTEACLVTSEACRVRWSELDVDQDSMRGPQQQEPPKIILSKTGEQLSFSDLQRQVNMQPSKNLIVPIHLPGAGGNDEGGDDDDDDDDDNDDEVAVFSASKMREEFKKGITNFESLD